MIAPARPAETANRRGLCRLFAVSSRNPATMGRDGAARAVG